MPKKTQAETFKHAYEFFAREIWPNIPQKSHITSLLIATDFFVLFDLASGESDEVIAIFSDGSKAIISTQSLQ
jgi:hypothetical protein